MKNPEVSGHTQTTNVRAEEGEDGGHYQWHRGSLPEARGRGRVLVTGSSTRPTAAVLVALSEAGYDVVVGLSVDETARPRATRTSRCYLLPPTTSPRYVDAVLATARRAGASVVVPTQRDAAWTFSHARRAFDVRGLVVVAPDSEVLDLCRDRARLLKTLEAVVPVPEAGAKCEGFSALAVRKRNSHDRGSCRVVREMSEDVADDEQVLEYLPGGEIWVDVVRSRDGAVETAESNVVRRRGRARLEGPAREDAVVRRLAVRAIEAVGLVGFATVRFRRDFVGLPRVIDILPGFTSSALNDTGTPPRLISAALECWKPQAGPQRGVNEGACSIASSRSTSIADVSGLATKLVTRTQ